MDTLWFMYLDNFTKIEDELSQIEGGRGKDCTKIKHYSLHLIKELENHP